MNPDPVSVNLYSIKDHLTSPAQADESLGRIARAGFDSVEIYLGAGLPGPETIKMLCDRHGLAVGGLHDLTVLDTPESSIQTADAVGAEIITYPYPEGRDVSKPDQVSKLIRDLDRAGQILSRHGKTLTYHNHHLEFMRTGRRTVLEQLLTGTDPRYVQFELDIYWVQYGGCDPVEWSRKFAGRLAQLHIKDYTVGADGQPRSCTVGQGNLDIPAVLNAAAGSQLIIEQEHYTADPFEELAQGLRFLRSL